MTNAETLRQRLAEIDQQLAALNAERRQVADELIRQEYFEKQEQVERDSQAFAADLRACQAEQGYLNLKRVRRKIWPTLARNRGGGTQ